jgi:predicted outer membrane repeat protein
MNLEEKQLFALGNRFGDEVIFFRSKCFVEITKRHSVGKERSMKASREFRMIVAVCALVACLSATVPAKIIYVDGDAQQVGDGSSWASALPSLQRAVATAVVGDEVHVAQGFYPPERSTAARSRAPGDTTMLPTVFQLRNGVAIMGGFAGIGAEDPDARDVERYPTILSGDVSGNDVEGWGLDHPLFEMLRADNLAYVVQSIGMDATAVLDGFVIESGTISNFFNKDGSPTIVNCVFCKGLTTTSGGAFQCQGGKPTLTNCTFQGNHAPYGSGGAIEAQKADVTLTNCRFLDNWARQRGGAINSTEGTLSLTGCAFESNAALSGGAVYQSWGTLLWADCTFTDNLAQQGGAAGFAVETASMTRCVFRRNWASQGGGALDDAGTPLALADCTFTGNRAGSYGGAVCASLSGPITASALRGRVSMTHCLCAGNRASSFGGALYADQTGFTIVNCTFVSNRASTGGTLSWSSSGTGNASAEFDLRNCIVWDSGPAMSPASRTAARTRGYGTSSEPEPGAVVCYSDIEGGWPGEGNIDVDPLFAVPGQWVNPPHSAYLPSSDPEAVWSDGDYHLKSQTGCWDPAGESWVRDEVTSPCIDAGDPATPVADEPAPNGGRINMGAYGGTTEASMSEFPPRP